MYPRLKIAKDLLSDDGVIFISIDDSELENLKKICNEIYGERNFIGCISRATGTTTGQDAAKIGSSLDYCLIYSRTKGFILNGLPLSEKDQKRFSSTDINGKFSLLQLRKTGNADTREDRPSMFYPISSPDGTEVYPIGPTGYLSRWRMAKPKYLELVKKDMIVWKNNGDLEEIDEEDYEVDDGKDGIEGESKTINVSQINLQDIVKSTWVPYVKYYLEGRTKQISNLMLDIEGNKKGSLSLKEIFGKKGIFDNPKPIEFLKILVTVSTKSNGIILDFFSGSASTAHAIMKLNAEDGGNRKYIMVQLPQETEDKSEAYKAGYKNICEIGKERIRRAGKKIKNETRLLSKNFDIGFRVLKLDNTNMEDVYYTPGSYQQNLLNSLADNIKPDRDAEDLLFQVMLDLGILLSSSIQEIVVGGKKVYSVADGYLLACFDKNVNSETVTEIAKRKPYYAIFRDSSMSDDSVATNFDQIFATYSPTTVRKVL